MIRLPNKTVKRSLSTSSKQVPAGTRKPIKVSWMLYEPMISKTSERDEKLFGICQCPGKKLSRGRNGVEYDRVITEDVENFKNLEKVDVIICLLNKYELKTIGVSADEYVRAAEKNNIELIFYPIIEMAAPEESYEKFQNFLEINVVEKLAQGKKVIAHCRGGIGRAGLVACCVLLLCNVFQEYKKAVQYVRSCRDKRCVESQKQMDFISGFQEFLDKNPKPSNKSLF